MKSSLIAAALAFGLTCSVSTPTRAEVLQQAVTISASPMPRSARCASASTRPDGPAASDARATEAELYLAIIKLRIGDRLPATLIVESRSIPIPRFRGRADQLGLIDGLPADLKQPVLDGLPDCVELTPDRFPAGAQLVPYVELRQGAGGGRADWASVAARFDGARMWFAVSRALISATRRDAVVFYERPCTARCGEAEWVWFHRDSPTAPWRVMKQVWSWIS